MIEIHKAQDRGGANHGWLQTKHSFSFANYYDPKRMGFGNLRVLNDDIIAPSKGFDTHPHENMEIITIVMRGELLHQDSTGTKSILRPGDVQVMSAGTGIMHSEHNNSSTEPLELFQLWIEPNKQEVKPRHEEMKYDKKANTFITLASGSQGGISIHQDAFVAIGTFSKPSTYKPTKEGSYLLIIKGSATINGYKLGGRDAIAMTEEQEMTIQPHTETTILLIDTKV